MKVLEDLFCEVDLIDDFIITGPVMTLTEVSPAHKDAIRSIDKPIHEEDWVNTACAHDPDYPHVGRVLKPCHPCSIGRCITTPVAEETEDARFVFSVCHPLLVALYSSFY